MAYGSLNFSARGRMGRGGLPLLTVRSRLAHLCGQRQLPPPHEDVWGAAAFLMIAVRGCLVLLLTSGSLTFPARGRVGRGSPLLLAARGRLVHLRGQRQPPSPREDARGAAALPFLAVRGRLVPSDQRRAPSLRLSPYESAWDAAALLLWPSVAAWPTCVAGGETSPTRDDVRGGAAVHLLTVRDHPPRARARGARQSIFFGRPRSLGLCRRLAHQAVALLLSADHNLLRCAVAPLLLVGSFSFSSDNESGFVD